MPRNRMIKPEFWTSEQVVECSTTARLLFVGMWNFCDDAGVIPYKLKSLKMQIFPGDDISLNSIDEWVKELIKNNLLIAYKVNNDEYLQVTGWHHQRIEKPSYKYPQFDDHSTTIRRVVDDHSTSTLSEEKRREEKGREEKRRDTPPSDKATVKKAYAIPSDYALSEKLINYARSKGLNNGRVEIEFEKFKNYFLSTGKKCVDWDRAFYNWVIRAGEQPQQSKVKDDYYKNWKVQ